MADLTPREVEQTQIKGGKAYGYARVSTDEQALTDSLESQEARIKEYVEKKLAHKGVEYAGTFRESRSGFKVPFQARPEACKLLLEAKRGDHIVFTRVDRFGRNMLNTMNQLAALHERGITPHCIGQHGVSRIDFTSQLHVAIAAALAEMESQEKRIRRIEADNYRKMHGKHKFKKNSEFGPLEMICGVRRTVQGPNRHVFHVCWAEYWWHAQLALCQGWFDSWNDGVTTVAQSRSVYAKGAFSHRVMIANLEQFHRYVVSHLHAALGLPDNADRPTWPTPTIRAINNAKKKRRWLLACGHLMHNVIHYPLPPPVEMQATEVPLFALEWDVNGKLVKQEMLQDVGEHVLPFDAWKKFSAPKTDQRSLKLMNDFINKVKVKIPEGHEDQFKLYVPI